MLSVLARVLSSLATAARVSRMVAAISPRSAATVPLTFSRLSSVREMLRMLSSLKVSLSRSSRLVAVVAMSSVELNSLDSADSLATMRGTGLISVGIMSGLLAFSERSWIWVMPVSPTKARRASVSVLIGVSALMRTRTSTLFGSRGSISSRRTSPTVMPLNCTVPPMPRPVTASENTTSYSCQLLSEANLAAQSEKPANSTATTRVNSPIRTWLARVSINGSPGRRAPRVRAAP